MEGPLPKNWKTGGFGSDTEREGSPIAAVFLEGNRSQELCLQDTALKEERLGLLADRIEYIREGALLCGRHCPIWQAPADGPDGSQTPRILLQKQGLHLHHINDDKTVGIKSRRGGRLGKRDGFQVSGKKSRMEREVSYLGILLWSAGASKDSSTKE